MALTCSITDHIRKGITVRLLSRGRKDRNIKSDATIEGVLSALVGKARELRDKTNSKNIEPTIPGSKQKDSTENVFFLN